MSERASKKAKRPRRTSAARGSSSESTERATIKTLERECDRLKAQLQETKERLVRLEESRSEAVNRIDWVIDSLHNVLERGA